MSTRRRIALAALLATLCVPFATTRPAQAGMEYCFTLDGHTYCIDIPVLIPIFRRWPIDPGPIKSVDISRITPELSDLVRGEATTLFVTDSLGRQMLVLDLKGGVAIDLNQNQSLAR